MAIDMSQPVTNNTALTLRMVDGSYHIYYPGEPKTRSLSFAELVAYVQKMIRNGGLLRVGDPDRYSDLCSITWVNAAHIVSFQKAGGSR